MRIHPQEGIHRFLAKTLLGAFLFLLVASFWALPCLTTKTGLSKGPSGPACREHRMSEARAGLAKLRLLPAEPAFRFLVALPAAFAALGIVGVLAARVIRPPGTVRAREGTLPFATADPPKLPAFAALRDA